jgi:hypothetical protein
LNKEATVHLHHTRYFLSSNSFVASLILAAAVLVPTSAAQADNRVPIDTRCGLAINSVVRTENALSTTNSVAFVDVPNAVLVFGVPAGASRCVKVVFTGEAACRGPAAVTDFCFIRALLDGVEMLPQGGGFQVFLSEDPTANAHAYEWVRRVGGGNHIVRIQRRVGNAGTFFDLDDWTFDLQIYQ